MATGRVSQQKSPIGHRLNTNFGNPHYVPNQSFNFWQDLEQNLAKKSKWEENTSSMFEQ